MSNTPDYAAWSQSWRNPMLRFARLHLRPVEEAEDAVQDTFVALLAVPSETWQQQDPRRYAFGILKHKIADRLRSAYRQEVSLSEAFDEDMDELLFDARGHWLEGVVPAPWVNPEDEAHTRQFFAIVDACVNKLPGKPARVFSMKEFLEFTPQEICSTLAITQADYWQCLSRARKQLQLCLHLNDFGRPRG